MKKWFYLILYLFVIFILTSCHTGRVLVDDNVQFSDDYETIIHNNVSYKVFNFLDSNLHRTISDDDILIYNQEPEPFMAAHQYIYKSAYSSSPFIYEEVGSHSVERANGFYLDEKVYFRDLLFVNNINNTDIFLFNEILNCENDEFYIINKELTNAIINFDDKSYDYYKALIETSKLEIDCEKLSKLEFYLKDDPGLEFNFEEIYFYDNNYYIIDGSECYKLSDKLVNIIIGYFNLN